MIFVLIKQSYEFCFDTRYIINFINQKFLLKVFLNIVLKKMSTFITMKDININIYNVNEYVKLQINLSNKNDIIKIKKGFHIVDDLIIKTFVDINIIKSKDMVFDIKKNVIIIGLYKNIQISFIFINHRSQTRFTIFNNNQIKITISSHFNMIISIIDLKCRSLKLSNDRDFFSNYKSSILYQFALISLIIMY